MTNLSTKALAISIPIGLLLTTHLKSLPFAYTVRSWFLLRALIKKAKDKKLKPDPLFSAVSQDHRCYLDDIDYNQHMNNSTYNKILDFNRIHVLYAIFPKMMMEPDHHVFGHNAGVVTLFRKEIPPLSRYTIQSRVWSWNEKWLFVQHRFLLENGTVACLAISKIVFKKLSGKTIPPKEVMELCGHDMSDALIEERRLHNWSIAQNVLNLDKIIEDPYPWSSKL
ncbi:hypothetical protein CU098_009884 [Rhizopus stolonifer]|uniref:Uncharacterized protein n=1 Tax=Rhizopus stolonifer TaxID=4846 RepID=A0A367JPM8_RHIST|nr:hypothetical protein CU098_009884 [Rhizopus stolonifer]